MRKHLNQHVSEEQWNTTGIWLSYSNNLGFICVCFLQGKLYRVPSTIGWNKQITSSSGGVGTNVLFFMSV